MAVYSNEELHKEQVEFIRRTLGLIRDNADEDILRENGKKFYKLFFDSGPCKLRKEDIETDHIEDYVKAFVFYGWLERDLFEDTRDFYQAMKENLPAERWQEYEAFLEGRKPLCFFRGFEHSA